MFRVRTTFVGLTGAPYLSTMYFEDTGGLTAANAVAAVGAFWGAIDNSLPNTLSWTTEAEVATIDFSNGQQTGLTSTTPQTGTGSIAATLHSPATQGLVRWRTGAFLGGRELRGRTFIPGMSTSVTNAATGAPNSTFLSAVNTAAAALIADANSTLLVWSRTKSAKSTVTSGSMWSQFAVLRSRRD